MKNQKGFTLIELAVVIAIIAILAAVAIPRFANTTATAECAMVKDLVSQLTSAASIYTAEQAAPPTGFTNYVTNNASPAAPFTMSLAQFGSVGGATAQCNIAAGTVSCPNRLRFYGGAQYTFNAGGAITLNKPITGTGGAPVCQ